MMRRSKFKPSAGEISDSEAMLCAVDRANRAHERAQAWEAVADKLAGVVQRMEDDCNCELGLMAKRYNVLAEYEALKGGK